MNEKKIAFIICVNDMLAYNECKYYLDHLRIPDGYETDIITITESPSMTAGYNTGMTATDAKYKVYLHQDVLIINPNFIHDMLNIFMMDQKIALIGMIGAKHLCSNVHMLMQWDTGKVFHNNIPSYLEFAMENTTYQEVEAVDGLLIATQFDIPWREELFNGWDFYDISQCMEFIRKDKKLVVPYQEKPWVWHDNSYCNLRKYYGYAELFAREYSDIRHFISEPVSKFTQKFLSLQGPVREQLCTLIDDGKRKEVTEFLLDQDNHRLTFLKDFQVLAEIEYLESAANTSKRLWTESDTAVTLLEKIREIKYLLKRAEFHMEDPQSIFQKIKMVYSSYAIRIIQEAYAFK